MLIKKRLIYPFWKIPIFVFKSLIVLIKFGQSGAFSLLINNNYLNKNFNNFLKISNYILYRKKRQKVGKLLCNCLINLGPGYIKFGQALSTRPDLIDFETCDFLKKLQDDIKPFSFYAAKEIVEKETKGMINDTFTSFDEKCVASASVAQVHKAVLKSGENVAVKILRPNIERLLLNDFIFFYWVANCIEFFFSKFKKI